jgi:2-isopropylmalate synthase
LLDSESALNDAFLRFKELADKKHEIFNEDLQALVTDSVSTGLNDEFQLVSMKVCSETGVSPCSTVMLKVGKREVTASAEGGGPVDATYKAIEKIASSGVTLQLYSVNAITSGTDSQGEVTVRLEKEGKIVNGMGSDTDIVIASARAYINGLNLMYSVNSRKHPQSSV